ncbi:MAG TPA: nucleotide exchange factor GrpE [Kofleriaceae bacterium]|nr:nucleotide exchange factor GrpE [Kofleriaceae bacterium]
MSDDVPMSDDPADPPTSDAGDPGLVVEVDAPSSGSGSGAGGRAAELEAALAKAEQERKDAWDKYVRAVADLENFRRRSKRDLDDAKADARTRVLKEMLPVIDNLERAVAHATDDGGAVLEGVRLVLRQFATALERCEVTPVEAEGKPFDPNLHEAIGQQESDAPAGTVISVLQKGYRLTDRLLRPAMVVVARPRQAAGGSGESA